LPRVALGTGPTGNFFSAMILCRALELQALARREIFSRPWFFAEHSSSRLSAQPVLRAHSGPSAKKK
jgi:hypothetical protein